MANGNEAARLNSLRDQIRAFMAERDWDQFRTPKNLATAIDSSSLDCHW